MISTHVLDTTRGAPAPGLAVRLEVRDGQGGWRVLREAATDADGRVRDLAPGVPGVYRLTFQTAAHFPDGLYPEVSVTFDIRDGSRHYHIPLLLSPYGYSTYRGS